MSPREKDTVLERTPDGPMYYAMGFRDALCVLFAAVRSAGVPEALRAHAELAKTACGAEPNPHVDWYIETHKSDTKAK